MKTFFAAACLSIGMILAGCSSDPPSVRVNNQRTTKVNTQVKPVVGNTININDIAAGATSGYTDIGEGRHDVTVTIQSESESPTASFTAENDNNYTVVVLATTPPTLRIDSEDK